jgi:hypothetical protein
VQKDHADHQFHRVPVLIRAFPTASFFNEVASGALLEIF